MSFPHNFLHISYTENDKKSHFWWTKVQPSFFLPKINEKLCLFQHISIPGDVFTCICRKLRFFIYSCMLCVINCEGLTSSPHLMNIHKDWSRTVFPKKLEISKIHNFLISYLIFVIFVPFCTDFLKLN